ncbi:uncharacterized protein LOC106072046 isoform X1 [Biomphalaria glabrata]|uniref:Uncharacterized protein LOC106072046 isoform X1 n=1 Tax=Biomphalaria glabrata TaxID=6526 RepID=A0A9W3AAB6_BIOGL|nr:uncharacterized protein LOC106072046 isoform X1 [Biomphalaria glabrata]XP_055884125.1 uncharacterized protein LOC106072046 isoform X1 [Biomphalaria glabrata]KAI8739717.1 putative nuclear protein localization protein 4 [Biomphalaria glabrata]
MKAFQKTPKSKLKVTPSKTVSSPKGASTPKEALTPNESKTKEEILKSFNQQAWKEYDQLYAELQFYSERAAMMHQYEASRFDRLSSILEIAAEILAVVSATCLSVYMFFKEKHPDGVLSDRTGLAGVSAMLTAGGMQFMGEGKGLGLPTFHSRGEKHKIAKAGWQRLARLTQSYRILMDDPRQDAIQYAAWFKELIDYKEQLCKIVSIQDSVVEMFDEPEEVIKPMRKNKLLFQRYMDLQQDSGKLD